MSGQYSQLIRRVAFCICALLVSTAAAAQGKTANPRLVVDAAAVMPSTTNATFAAATTGASSGDVLVLAGENFGSWPTVFLAGKQLTVINVSPKGDLLTAELSDALEPGSYLV